MSFFMSKNNGNYCYCIHENATTKRKESKEKYLLYSFIYNRYILFINNTQQSFKLSTHYINN